MCIATFVNLVGLYRNSKDFKTFFEGFGNQINSILLVGYVILLSTLGIYIHVRIYKDLKSNKDIKA
jgi:hypothetical protein